MAAERFLRGGRERAVPGDAGDGRDELLVVGGFDPGR
jgi:hypothetical protein